jgi:endonuclease/exonuclease/phosphatase family metal-dependent hydrolase
MIWVGDFNSDASGGPVTGVPPMTATYGEVLAAGFEDAWAKQHPANTGLTCCFAADLRDPAPAFTSRIDLVLTRGRFEVENAKVIGAAEADRLPSGLWPSDHAGVVATLSMDD